MVRTDERLVLDVAEGELRTSMRASVERYYDVVACAPYHERGAK
jgi:hypothetical protein